jgi:hypothetical protein
MGCFEAQWLVFGGKILIVSRFAGLSESHTLKFRRNPVEPTVNLNGKFSSSKMITRTSPLVAGAQQCESRKRKPL